jgi:hypothetical protein
VDNWLAFGSVVALLGVLVAWGVWTTRAEDYGYGELTDDPDLED